MHKSSNGVKIIVDTSEESPTVNRIVFYVNGKKIEDANIEPQWTVLHYLRNNLRLCGTKLGCGEGGCGACTIMVSKYDRLNKKITHFPVNACLAPICSMHGLAITTVEGIGSTKTKLHPVQERIAKSHGSQCGFCTPGMVMSMYTLLRNTPKPTMRELETTFQGNLCRCTGYRPILEGYKTFTQNCVLGGQCCQQFNNNTVETTLPLFKSSEFYPYHPTQEIIFPPELKLLTHQYKKEYLVIKNYWFRPTTLEQLLILKHNYPTAKITAGHTEVGIEIKFKHTTYPALIHIGVIEELRTCSTNLKGDGVTIGATTTLTELELILNSQIEKLPEFKTRAFKIVLEMLDKFGGKQIRSVGTIGGNLINASPISDLIPILLVCRTTVQIKSHSVFNETPKLLDELFFVSHRKTLLTSKEILTSLDLPYSEPDQYFYAYKQSRRRDDDITIVNIAMNVKFQKNCDRITKILIAFGGLSFRCAFANKTQEKLIGLHWNAPQTLTIAQNSLIEDFPLNLEAPGGMIEYRKALLQGLFLKAYLNVARQQKLQSSAAFDFRAPSNFKSAQYCYYNNNHDDVAIQKPIVHTSAFKQTTGEAIYCDDIPKLQGELYLAFVFSTEAHAKILKIEPQKALNLPGVYDFLCARNIDHKLNKIGAVVLDECVFYNEVVTSCGQIIGAVVADNQIIAQKAAKLVRVHYEKLEPVILTIEDAIKYNSYFFEPYKVFTKGDVEVVFKNAPHFLEGDCRTGGQEHFYLETQVCLCVPKGEDGAMEIYSSTQNPAEISKVIAQFLGVQQNKVICKTKRLGGGFGGKESKATNLCIPVALAAAKLNRPVRVMLDRDEDIISTGGRHPFYTKYKVAFDNSGKILGCDVQIYSNCGHSVDVSLSVLQRAMIHFENAYNIPVMRIRGYPCRTNLPSNTAFRGFGAPQGMFVAECMIRDVSNYLNKGDTVLICELNLYKEGDLTHYNQRLINCTIGQCWKEVKEYSNYYQRRKDVETFNKKNRYKKRGLSMIPTKYGVAFTAPFLNQGGALILVYFDGSVLLSHGGVEMGQGLHTKMIHIASTILGIPAEKIHTIETSTDTVPNTSPTAASSSSDINGMAVLEACNVIKALLEPFKKANPKDAWEDWVKQAYHSRINLSATGFYKTPDLGYNWAKKSGNLFNYFTYGAAVSEVEVDTLTGDHQVIRTDIVMDLGQSLNPAIDVGQIEGAFMQGYGLFALEEMLYTPSGSTCTKGPSTYKIPAFSDVPLEFNVRLLKGSSNPRAVYSSKAVGEPPLFLASSVFFAIGDAIKAARDEFGITGDFRMNSAPATVEKIKMCCHNPQEIYHCGTNSNSFMSI